MNTSLKLKVGLVVGLILFSIMTVTPSFVEAPNWWKKNLAPEGFKKGLDLQGGIHLVLRVDIDKAVANALDLAGSELKDGLSDQNITVVALNVSQTDQITYALPNTSAVTTVKTLIGDNFPDLDVQVQAEAGTFPRITIRLTEEKVAFIRTNAVDQVLEIIRNRIDQFGVAEPVIIRQGDREIVVQLPGVKDPERATKLIKETAQLEFKLVADENDNLDLAALLNEAVESGRWNANDFSEEGRRKLNLAVKKSLPVETAIYFQKITRTQNNNPATKQERKVPILLKSRVMMTGEMVKGAQVRMGGTYNEPMVSLDLTSRGGKIFGVVTEKNVNKRFAIILDGVVSSAPVIQEKILGGSAQITGRFTHAEANDLAIALRVGALPAPVEIIQKMSVGASLGQESIDRGLYSGLFGALLVLGFMIIYYRLSGVIANFTLLLNILFLFVGLAVLSATLTLPGIAGIILSIGMAVDANVLIFERMREEFALGRSPRSGVDNGYKKAYWSIVDSQVTTLITALALFLFGTGPIKGFAVTLSLGIVFNLFAVLFCSHLIYDVLYSARVLKKLQFMQFVKKANFNFMSIKQYAFVFSGVMVCIGLLAFVQVLRGEANLGVDFSGGSMLQYKAEKPFKADEIRLALKNQGWDLDPQLVRGENRVIIRIKKSEEIIGNLSQEIGQALKQGLPEHVFTLESQSEIGSSVSTVLRNKAIQAIFISLLGVICYLALRFDVRFGLAAAAATFHDVMVVLGLCWLLNLEITLLIVTALLTLAGYSLNDSVVVFDRIRENMHKAREKAVGMHQIINDSINQVMGRTVVTSMTTMLVLASLFFFGGQAIHEFSLALLLGIMVGTYSSIFIASPLLTVKAAKK